MSHIALACHVWSPHDELRQPTFSASLCKKKFLVEQIIESLTGIFPGFFSAELETRLRLEKAGALKQVDNRIIALKRDINKLKDVLVEYGTYEVSEKKLANMTTAAKKFWTLSSSLCLQRFLHSMSPSAWRQLTSEEASEQTGAISTLKSLLTGSK